MCVLCRCMHTIIIIYFQFHPRLVVPSIMQSAETKIAAGHWTIFNHFSELSNQNNSQVVIVPTTFCCRISE